MRGELQWDRKGSLPGLELNCVGAGVNLYAQRAAGVVRQKRLKNNAFIRV